MHFWEIHNSKLGGYRCDSIKLHVCICRMVIFFPGEGLTVIVKFWKSSLTWKDSCLKCPLISAKLAKFQNKVGQIRSWKKSRIDNLIVSFQRNRTKNFNAISYIEGLQWNGDPFPFPWKGWRGRNGRGQERGVGLV